MIYPDKTQYYKLKDNYNIIPFIKEIEGDIDTPISLFKKLCTDKTSYLLESVEGGDKWGRYSFIGRNPHFTIKGYENKVSIINPGKNSEIINGKYLDVVREIFSRYTMPDITGFSDFIGGAVGYIAYDIIRDFENLTNVNSDDLGIPDIHLLIMEEIIVYDHLKQKILIIFNQFTEDNKEDNYEYCLSRICEIEDEINNNKIIIPVSPQYEKTAEYKSNETRSSYMEKVEKAKEYIKKGDIFQVVLSQRLQINSDVNPLELYRVLRRLNPSPYMYYISYGDYQVVGSSPELLVKVTDGIIETCPIAGTRPRGKDKEEDEKFEKDLLSDEKETAEHLMLVDLARNDIGKLSEFGSVKVNQFMEVHRFSHVMHLVSNVVGELNSKHDMFDVLISSLPAGTVSGAPKIRAMEIIDELENNKRGIYAGGVGYFGFNGNMDICIAIRTVLFNTNKAYIQAGAGIVADSVPSNEYDETLRKAGALLEAFEIAGRENHDSNN